MAEFNSGGAARPLLMGVSFARHFLKYAIRLPELPFLEYLNLFPGSPQPMIANTEHIPTRFEY